MHLEEGATIGSSIKVNRDGIEIDTLAEGKINISEEEGFVSSNETKGLSIRIGGASCANVGASFITLDGNATCPSKPVPLFIAGSDDYFAIQCGSGMFGGLRLW